MNEQYSHTTISVIVFILAQIMINLILYYLGHVKLNFIFLKIMNIIVILGYTYHLYTTLATPIQDYSRELADLERVEGLAKTFLAVSIGLALLINIMNADEQKVKRQTFKTFTLFSAAMIGFAVLPLWSPNNNPKYLRILRDIKTYIFTGGMTLLAVGLMYHIFC